jgi:hypothetical protein
MQYSMEDSILFDTSKITSGRNSSKGRKQGSPVNDVNELGIFKKAQRFTPLVAVGSKNQKKPKREIYTDSVISKHKLS